MLPIERLAGARACARGHEPPPLPRRRRRRRRAASASASACPAAPRPPTARARPATNVVAPFEAYIRIAPDNTRHGARRSTSRWARAPTPASPRWSPRSWTPTGRRCGPRVPAATPKLYGNLAWGGNVQGTGGSTAMASSYMRCARPARSARAMLVAAAAQQWKVPAERDHGREGRAHAPVRQARHHGRARRRCGQLGDEQLAAMQPADDIPLKDPGLFKLIGNPSLRRLDTVAKTTGQPSTPSTSAAPAC